MKRTDRLKSRLYHTSKKQFLKLLEKHGSVHGVTKELAGITEGTAGTLYMEITKAYMHRNDIEFKGPKARKNSQVAGPFRKIFSLGKKEDPRMQPYVLLHRLVKEGGRKHECSNCGLGPRWRGKPITLQVHHKDGQHWNNQPSNLEILCPNCHTQTHNHCVTK